MSLPEFSGVAAAVAEDAAAGRLSPQRLALAASLGDRTARDLLGDGAPKSPRGVTAWWGALGPDAQEPEVGVRALVTVSVKLAKHAARPARDASAAAWSWTQAPSEETAAAARDAAFPAVERYQGAPARMRPVASADEAVGIIAMHAAWSVGILPRLSYDAAEWSLLLERALEATGAKYRSLRTAVDRALIPWALGLDVRLWGAYQSAGSKRKKAKRAKAKKKDQGRRR